MSSFNFSTGDSIISLVRGEARLGSNPPNAAFQTTQMRAKLTDINEWFWMWPINNGMSPFKMSRGHILIQSKSNTNLAVAADAADTSLTLSDGDDFGSPTTALFGAAMIKNSEGTFEFVTFSENASDILSSVEGLSIDHAVSSEVHLLYGLPANFYLARQLRVYQRKPYIHVDGEFDDVPPPGYYHTKYMKRDDGNNRWFIALPESVPEHTFSFHYIEKPNTISSATDKINAPDGVGRWAIIEKMKEYVWEIRGEDAKAGLARQRAETLMEQFCAKEAILDDSPEKGPMYDL